VDALAHGRVFAGPSEEEFRIVKFSKPDKGATEVNVVYSAVMDEAWFNESKARVRTAIETVMAAIRSQKPTTITLPSSSA